MKISVFKKLAPLAGDFLLFGGSGLMSLCALFPVLYLEEASFFSTLLFLTVVFAAASYLGYKTNGNSRVREYSLVFFSLLCLVPILTLEWAGINTEYFLDKHDYIGLVFPFVFFVSNIWLNVLILARNIILRDAPNANRVFRQKLIGAQLYLAGSVLALFIVGWVIARFTT